MSVGRCRASAASLIGFASIALRSLASSVIACICAWMKSVCSLVKSRTSLTCTSSILCEIAGVDVAGSFHAPLWPKPAITLSRKDWHSSANGE